MPVRPQKVEVDFDGGLDTGTDAKGVGLGNFLVLENAVRKKNKRLQPRPGTVNLSKSISGGSSQISSGSGLAVYNNELIEFGSNKLYTRNESKAEWIDRGSVSSTIVSHTQIVRNSYQQTQVQAATNQGITVFSWKDSRGGVRASVIDEQTGSYIQSDTVISSTADRPKVHAIGNTIWVFYNETSDLKARSVTVGAPTSFTTATTLKSDLKSAEPFFDVVNFGSRMVMAYHKSDSTIHMFFMNEAGTVTPSGSPAEVTISERAEKCLTLVNLDDMYLFPAWHNTTSGVRVRGFDSNFNALFAISTLDSDTAQYDNICGVKTATNQVRFFYEKNAALTYNQLIKHNTVTTGGALGTSAVFKRSVGLASKPFSVSGSVYVWAAHETTQQSTFFLFNESGEAVAQTLYGRGGGLIGTPNLPAINPNDDLEYIFPCCVKNRIETENNVSFSTKGVNRTNVSFSDLSSYNNVQLGDNLFIIGGAPQIYDGTQIVESSFQIYPENVTIAQSGAAGVPNGTYGYAVLYKWIDAKGQIDRSAVFVQSFAVTGGPRNVTLTIPTLRVTKRSNVVVDVYRTENNGTVYYRITSVSSPTFNDTTVDTVSYVDTATDASITSNEILYTQGGILENIVPNPCSFAAVHRNRIFLKTDLPNVIQYSKEWFSFESVLFNDLLTKTIDPFGGEITALASMDDKLIIFKRTSIRAFTGDGPNDAGADDTFTQDELITTDIGCVDPNSVVLMPDGLMFKGDKGVYLLDRGLQVTYIGKPVEDYNTYTITSAVLKEGDNHVRFTTESGPCLVYDYYFKQWSVFTAYDAVDALNYNGVYYFLKPDGTVRQETPDSYDDAGSQVPFNVGTAWLKFDGLQGYQRVLWVHILGNYRSAHQLKLDLSYDYEDAIFETVTVDPADALNTSTWGSDATWGASGTTWGGTGETTYQFRHKPRRQKCQSMKLGISGIQSSPYGEGFQLNGLALTVGVYSGANRLREAKTF